MKWRMLRSILDAVECSDLDLVAVEYDVNRLDGLHLRLEGGSHRSIESMWQSIAGIPGIVLADWQSCVGLSRHCEEMEA